MNTTTSEGRAGAGRPQWCSSVRMCQYRRANFRLQSHTSSRDGESRASSSSVPQSVLHWPPPHATRER
eukprot:6194116-Pleurochrysis_carterae.AAC.3